MRKHEKNEVELDETSRQIRDIKKNIEDQEKKYQQLIDRRNKLNEEAALAREERDKLNESKRELRKLMDEYKKGRDAVVEQMRQAKKKRDEYRKRAMTLLDMKKKKKGNIKDGLHSEIGLLENEIENMERWYETHTMSADKEKEYIEKIKHMRARLDELKKIMPEQDVIKAEIDNIDNLISELFKKADEEHNKVIELKKKADELHQKFVDTMNAISRIIPLAEAKHKEYLELREKADEMHKKAKEMKSTIISLKNERRNIAREAKEVIINQNKKVNQLLEDETKKEEALENALETLMKKGKIEL